MLNRAESILNDVRKLSKALPISKVIVEIASFDTQKMANALIEGVEYQHGTLFGYEIKQYLLTVFKHKCAYCSGLSGDKFLQIEHIHPSSKDGSDKISNLTIACRECNKAKDSMTLAQWEKVLCQNPNEINLRRLKNIPALKKQSRLKKGFQYSALTPVAKRRGEAAFQSYKNYLLAELGKDFKVGITYGAKTKYHRIQLSLPKTQINDALCIASEGEPFSIPSYYILEKQVKKRYPHDYISPPKKGQQIVKYKREKKMFSFQLWGKVNCNHPKLGKVVGYIQGRRTSGSFAIASLDGNLLIGGISYKKLTLKQPATSNYIRERRTASSPPDCSNQKGSPP